MDCFFAQKAQCLWIFPSEWYRQPCCLYSSLSYLLFSPVKIAESWLMYFIHQVGRKKKKKRHHSTCLDEPTTCSTNQTTEEINKVLGLVSNKVFLLMQTAPATMCMSRNVKGTLLGDGTQRFIPVRQ